MYCLGAVHSKVKHSRRSKHSRFSEMKRLSIYDMYVFSFVFSFVGGLHYTYIRSHQIRSYSQKDYIFYPDYLITKSLFHFDGDLSNYIYLLSNWNTQKICSLICDAELLNTKSFSFPVCCQINVSPSW